MKILLAVLVGGLLGVFLSDLSHSHSKAPLASGDDDNWLAVTVGYPCGDDTFKYSVIRHGEIAWMQIPAPRDATNGYIWVTVKKAKSLNMVHALTGERLPADTNSRVTQAWKAK